MQLNRANFAIDKYQIIDGSTMGGCENVRAACDKQNCVPSASVFQKYTTHNLAL